MPETVFLLDDEENIVRSLAMILEREGYAVRSASSAAEFRRAQPWLDASVILMDVRLPDGNGIDLLREVRQASTTPPPVIMISGHASIADAVEATRIGAWDFLEKPLARDRVLLGVKNALESSRLQRENERLRGLVEPPQPMIGESPAYMAVVQQATLAAHSDARVLISGESGTGKELLAGHIHANSPFREGPFVKVNCAAIPTELLESELFGHEKGSFTGATSLRRGKFELANNGTIFLDEVGDLLEGSQAKLLRVLQEGEFHRVGGEKSIRVSVRVIAATNRDLPALVAAGRFREDLYYRLCVVPLRMPALRERTTDIAALAVHFLSAFCARNNFRPKLFHPDVFPAFQRHFWPGNIRELRNTVERMAILAPGDELALDAVPTEIRNAVGNPGRGSIVEVRESAERDHLQAALEQCGWNISAAARQLGMERTNLHKRIRALRIEKLR